MKFKSMQKEKMAKISFKNLNFYKVRKYMNIHIAINCGQKVQS